MLNDIQLLSLLNGAATTPFSKFNKTHKHTNHKIFNNFQRNNTFVAVSLRGEKEKSRPKSGDSKKVSIYIICESREKVKKGD
nr:MAG TPA: Serine/threonine-protein phosphatase 2A 65 kDa, shugoshin, Nucleus, Phosphoprotein, Hydrolase.7A [Caudoviricetes sp.]